MQTDRPSALHSLLRTLFLPYVLLTLVAGMVSVMIFKADLWVEDGGIVYSSISEIPGDNWLPRQLWKVSHFLAAGEASVYRIWNVLAIWGLSLTVFAIMRLWLEQSHRVSPWLRSQVALLAGLLCTLHPICGMTACAISHLDWQLATFFGTLSLLAAHSMIQRPRYAALVQLVLWLLLGALSAPAGLLLGVGALFVTWQLASPAKRSLTAAWFSAKQGWRPLVVFCSAVLIMGLGWFLHLVWQKQAATTGLSWSTHLLTQGQIFWSQLRGLLTPTDLLPSHTIAWSEQWTDWVSVTGLLLLGSLTILTALSLCQRRSDARRPLYAIVLLALWPSILILGWRTADAFSEARWYAALPWGAMFAAWVVGWIITRWNALKYPLGLAIPLFLAFTNIGQLSRFQDADQVIAMILEKEPQNLRMRCFAAELQAQQHNNTAVMRMNLPTEAAYRDIVAYNETNTQGRRYDLVSALRWWVDVEHLVQVAIQKNFGIEYAQAYASTSKDKFAVEVRNIAAQQPEALPLLALFPSSNAPEQPTKPKPVQGIPGIGTAVGVSEFDAGRSNE
jgi:hypothetical protein